MGEKNDRGEEFDRQMRRALAHPLRVEILRQLEKGPSSPTQLADCIGDHLSNVSYHTKVLLECECIELVEIIPRRGAVEHIYRLKPGGTIGSGAWREVPPALRTHYAGSSLTTFTERAIEALDAGTAESREGSGLTWLPLTIDEQGWKELRRVRRKVEDLFRAVGDRSAERMEGTETGIPVIVAVAAFEVGGRNDADPS